MQDLQTQLTEKTEEIKSIKTMAHKSEAIWTQKHEFNDVQMNQLKKSLDEQKKQNENLMQVISDKDSNDNSGKEQTMKQFEDVKLRHQAEVSQLDSSVQSLQSESESSHEIQRWHPSLDF